ncbi:hypothetical protein HDG42_000781 [Paraburkholderia sp. JPY171]|nr:hypothetical protein [Paraburkholderia atlantica]
MQFKHTVDYSAAGDGLFRRIVSNVVSIAIAHPALKLS